MSDSIQEQINALDQSIRDLEASASGVNAYILKLTFDTFSDRMDQMIDDLSNFADTLDNGIVDASGSLNILKNGIFLYDLTH